MNVRALSTLALLAACQATPPVSRTAVTPAPAPALDARVVETPASLPAPPPPPAVTLESASSFTDEPVLQALAANPRWRPADWESPDAVLSCEGSLHPQSCSPNPCHEGLGDRCRTQCGVRCNTCDGACRAAAERCARPCADDACRLACARVNGQCLDVCIRAKDQCVTGVCDPQQARCERAQERAFYDGPCRPACVRCTEQCADVELLGECYQRCFRRVRGCTVAQQSICIMEGPTYGEPEDASAP